MDEAVCPRCQLPRDDGAWHCDGCGHEFSSDVDAVRARLEADAAGSRRTLVVTVLVDAALVAAVIYLAMRGFFYISVPLALTVLGSIGHALHRISVTREYLSSFNRRHAPLPVATVRG